MQFLARFYFSLVFLTILSGCSYENKPDNSNHKKRNDSTQNRGGDCIGISRTHKVLDLISISKTIPGIKVNLAYASAENFMHEILYLRCKEAYLQKEVALKLAKAQTILSKVKPGYFLLVYDAARPLSVQKRMWKALDSIPENIRSNYVSPPTGKSLHNYGCAVDLTICNEEGVPLDMGADFDEFRPIAYPSLETKFLEQGLISEKQVSNRKLLRKVMFQAGFKGIDTEWWHFNAFPLKIAKEKFEIIETEKALSSN